ncbi:MAG: hypothetical protein BWY11_01217 [Firmicutes bacterium ADurb.Bin182]|nr:MAG: hypothetical protein BWY11_01217 [Firmicutes bacterium ADurb.Bin182]
MKLIMAIVQNDDAKRLTRQLVNEGIRVTRMASTGGFLHGGNTTLMIGVEDDELDSALKIIKEKSSMRKEYMVIPTSLPGYTDNAPTPVQVTLGGATVFVIDVEQTFRF